MKKGFTLAELLGVIVILGALMLVIIPLVSTAIKDADEELYNSQIESIKLSLESWMSDNQRPNEGEYITLSLSQLKEAGLVELDITNPKTKELFPNDMILKIINNNGTIEYEVNENGSNTNNYESISSIKITYRSIVTILTWSFFRFIIKWFYIYLTTHYFFSNIFYSIYNLLL